MTRSLRLSILALFCVGPAAYADVVYKCVDAAGKTTYSQNPCYGENWHRFGAPQPEQPKAKPTSAKPANESDPASAKRAQKKPASAN